LISNGRTGQAGLSVAAQYTHGQQGNGLACRYAGGVMRQSARRLC